MKEKKKRPLIERDATAGLSRMKGLQPGLNIQTAQISPKP